MTLRTLIILGIGNRQKSNMLENHFTPRFRHLKTQKKKKNENFLLNSIERLSIELSSIV